MERIQIQKTQQISARRRPELDLRSPSGRRLPY